MFTPRTALTSLVLFGLILVGCSQGEESQAKAEPAATPEAPAGQSDQPDAQVAKAPSAKVDWSLPGASADLPMTTADILSERSIGDPNAPVTIVEYSSLTCPHCANLHANILPQIKTDLIDTGKARLVFQDYPLGGLAAAAAIMARCAPPKNYFKLLNVLFHDQMKWARAESPLDALHGYMTLAGLPRDRATECLQNTEALAGIQAWMKDGESKYAISGTPTLVINGEVVSQVGSFEQVASVVNRLAK